MTTIKPTGHILGATVRGINLAEPLSDPSFAAILQGLGAHGVLHFPDQKLEARALRDFSSRFGRIQATLSGRHHEPGMPEVGILSNIIENGEPIGITDAGQDWHTDMSYNETIGFLNVLYAVKVPRRDGRVLGATMFANTQAAYEGLAPEIKERLRTATATHDFNKFWENMRRRPGSLRDPLTPEQRRKRPPSVHPVFLTHPITGKTVLYCNPGYATRINELDEVESERMLALLFAHQLQPRYQYTHQWTEGDVLAWDHIGTLHNAIADYGPEEHRLMKRCQVMADRCVRACLCQAEEPLQHSRASQRMIRARIGVLVPAGNPTVEPEFYRMAPTGVTIHFARLDSGAGAPGTPEAMERRTLGYLDALPGAVRILADVRPAVIVLAHTGVSYLNGAAGEAALAARLSELAGTRATTAAGAISAGLRQLGVKRLALATPYPESISVAGRAFWAASGFDIVGYHRLPDVANIYEETEDRAYMLGRAADVAAAEAVLISGTGLPTAGIIERLERELGKPVVTSQQASLWRALRLAGITDAVAGFGRLLREPDHGR